MSNRTLRVERCCPDCRGEGTILVRTCPWRGPESEDEEVCDLCQGEGSVFGELDDAFAE